MKNKDFLRRVILGLKQNPLRACTGSFIAYASVWTVLEPLISIVSPIGKLLSGELNFFLLLLISCLIGLYRNTLPKNISIQYRNSEIKIIFGDLFLFDGIKAVPASRYLLEIDVIPASLQNKVIQLFVQSEEGPKGFDIYGQRLSLALEQEPHQNIYRSAIQRKDKYYPLGTTAVLELRDEYYMLFALTETELKGYIPDDNCNVSKMWDSLESFWQKARIYSRGKPINIPLIGSGVTGIKFSPSQILELNLLAIANAIEEGGKITTEEIRIILHPKYMETINLNDFKDLWKIKL